MSEIKINRHIEAVTSSAEKCNSPFILSMNIGAVLEEELNNADPVVPSGEVEGCGL